MEKINDIAGGEFSPFLPYMNKFGDGVVWVGFWDGRTPIKHLTFAYDSIQKSYFICEQAGNYLPNLSPNSYVLADEVTHQFIVLSPDAFSVYKIGEFLGCKPCNFWDFWMGKVNSLEFFNMTKLTDIKVTTQEEDAVNHPQHYCSHPSGIECIEVTRHYDFSIGNVIKYLWRAGLKRDADKSSLAKEIEDLKKARWYLDDAIAYREKKLVK